MNDNAMPIEVAKAVIAVAKQIKQLGRDAKNEWGGWQYASVDAFYGAIGPLMAEAGLFTVVDESAPPTVETRESTNDKGVSKTGKWLTSHYDITLHHESGASWGPIRRTMMVLASGPQAFGHGVSYVDKYFLRTLFKVPTGEQGEVDSHEPAGLPDSGDLDWAETERTGNAILAAAKTEPDLKLAWETLTDQHREACWKEKDRLRAVLLAPAKPADLLVAKWLADLEIAGADVACVNALIRDSFVKIKGDVACRNDIWTMVMKHGQSQGWAWNRETKCFEKGATA
jgi:hypothetical protein